MGHNNRNFYVAKYLDFLLDGNWEHCKLLAGNVLGENSLVIDLYEHVFCSTLYEFGELWEINKICAATEHLSTTIAEGLLYEFFELNLSEKQFIYGNYNRGNL